MDKLPVAKCLSMFWFRRDWKFRRIIKLTSVRELELGASENCYLRRFSEVVGKATSLSPVRYWRLFARAKVASIFPNCVYGVLIFHSLRLFPGTRPHFRKKSERPDAAAALSALDIKGRPNWRKVFSLSPTAFPQSVAFLLKTRYVHVYEREIGVKMADEYCWNFIRT